MSRTAYQATMPGIAFPAPADPAATPAPPTGLPVAGQVIDGNYRIVEMLGEGGMGVVMRAHDEALRRDVALKFIRPQYVAHPVAREQFTREANAMARVRSENVIEVYAAGEHAGLPYLVMRLVEGMTLEDWLDKRGGVPATLDEVFGFLRQICLGVEAIHDAGATHHDLKPSNVLIDRSYRVSVADFGLAQFLEAAKQAGLISSGGTPEYMAPEIWLGERLSPELARRADIYALGIIAYALLTGQAPFRGESIEDYQIAHLTEDVVPPSELRPELPPEIDDVILRALAKHPAERTASARQFREGLGAARSVQVRPYSNRRIVLASPDATQLALLQQSLLREMPAVDIELAQSGAEVDQLLRYRSPDLLILDLQVSDPGPVELLQQITPRARGGEARVMCISGIAELQAWSQLYPLGAEALLPKPINPAVFAGFARTLVRP